MNREKLCRIPYGKLTDEEQQARDIALDMRHSDDFILWLRRLCADHATQARGTIVMRTAYAMRKGWGRWK